MKRLRFWILLLAFAIFLTSCSGLTTTASSIESLRVTTEMPREDMRLALNLDCESVASCENNGLHPDTYWANDGEDKVFVWSYDYGILEKNNTLFYVVVYRPNENTWDAIGFEYKDGGWIAGVYGGLHLVTFIKTMPIYDSKWYVNSVESNTVALGFNGENWAVIVSGESESTFRYLFIPDYWTMR